MDTFKTFVNRQFQENFDIIFMENTKNCIKKKSQLFLLFSIKCILKIKIFPKLTPLGHPLANWS